MFLQGLDRAINESYITSHQVKQLQENGVFSWTTRKNIQLSVQQSFSQNKDKRNEVIFQFDNNKSYN
jgi:hypothetical protein